ncbi:MAG: hypothetical protein M1816_000038 [Peltula sp. TS41687]|nr:MAG: hypothetical protein M1816_000038 [Peltula sp. TS41687]
MASTTTSSENRVPSTTSQSYSSMDKADVEAIGAHCQSPYCRQLDFLPFRCESCRGTYCLDHRTETSHQCPKAGAWAAARRQNSIGGGGGGAKTSSSSSSSSSSNKPSLPESKCAATPCKTMINTSRNLGVHCSSCNRHYCLKHRFRDDHDCAKLIPLGARPSTTTTLTNNAQKARLAIAKLKAWGSGSGSGSGGSSRDKQSPFSSLRASSKPKPPNPITALNELKRAAKGDPSLGPDKRIYLHVEAASVSTDTQPRSTPLYFNKDWSIGRLLDAAARSLQIPNVNNHGGGEDDRLRVFHVEGGRLLDFGETLNDVVRSGNTLVLLRGVGPPQPDLIDLTG